jgi:hypothetical protein
MTDVHLLAIQSFLRVLGQRLVDKGVFSQSEMADLFNDWFEDVLAIGQDLQESGDERNVDDVLKIIHSLTVEFTSK